ncbi:uncharacterized protein LOC131947911 [Physella acuta]|uniref:uncharacterized protein LOC131947911 n=1 Tax=Physella acuta TaxID=109671 RepID=UPI0027DC1BD5|nr:uncharacterized protein LOC131947911 [Physella acuta]
MYLDVLFGFIILLLWRSKGCGQTFNDKIVSPSVVEAGGSFTLKCDASRAGVPVDVTTVAMLIISWKFGAKTEKLAHYYTYIEPNISTFRENWNFSFSGNLQRTTQFPKNRNTMRIEVAVSSAKCADAGSYVCYAQHLNSRYDTIPTESFQNLTITFTAPRTMSVNVNPPSTYKPNEFIYYRDSEIELTCSVEKRVNDVNFRWMFGSSLSNVSSFLPFTAQNAISVTKTNSSGSTCNQFRHSSTLRIKTEEKYDGYMYMCMATDNRETISGNMTIYVLDSGYGYLLCVDFNELNKWVFMAWNKVLILLKEGTRMHGENVYNSESNTILSLKEVREGESFKVTCDASRAGVSYMVAQALEIEYKYGKKDPVKIAEYTTSTPPKRIQVCIS